MRAWSTALAAELADWPGVTTKSFFGFTALYRGKRIFALLPRTRAWGNANTLAFKLENPTPKVRTLLGNDRRVGSMDMAKFRWFTLDLSCDGDLHDAVEWLARAYEQADKPARKK